MRLSAILTKLCASDQSCGVLAIDIPRKTSHWPRRLRLAAILFGIAVVTLVAVNYLAARLRTDALDVGELVIAEVQRSSLIRDVRAPGVLVPTELRWIATDVEGRVENILTQPGEYVLPDTVILELGNPNVALDADTAGIELEVLRAQTLVLEKRMSSDLLAQQAIVAEYASSSENARFRMEANKSLGDVVARVDLNESLLTARQLEERLAIEQERYTRLQELQKAELAASKAEIRRAQRHLQLQQQLLSGLTVRAGIEGILQEVSVEPGQLLAPGSLLARVAREDNFKTELRVQEGQAREVVIGQKVIISAGGQQRHGKVVRIDPAVAEGTVLVDVAFTGETLPGARPDLRVQGVIEIDYVEDTLVLARPVFTEENTSRELFVLNADGMYATRTPVELGIGSVDRIEILGGLQEGDRVIVSDVRQHSHRDVVALTGALR